MFERLICDLKSVKTLRDTDVVKPHGHRKNYDKNVREICKRDV